MSRAAFFLSVILSLLCVSATAAQTQSPGSKSAANPPDADAVEVHVGDMQATPEGVSVTLQATHSDEQLYIMIGVSEGESIARALEHVQTSRPMTHDLMKTILDRTGWQVQRVLIRAVQGDSYIADLVLGKDGQTMVLDARPSDAMALAVRTDAKIYVSRAVLDQQQMQPQQGPSPEPSPGASPDQPQKQTPSKDEGMHL